MAGKIELLKRDLIFPFVRKTAQRNLRASMRKRAEILPFKNSARILLKVKSEQNGQIRKRKSQKNQLKKLEEK